MSLRKRREQAAQTSKATKKIGLVAKLIVDTGIAPHGRGITAAIRDECFRPYGDNEEVDVREQVEKATAVSIKHLPVNNFSVGAVLRVRVVPDTSLTPTSRWTGGTYSMEEYDKSNRFTHKRHSDFIFDFMSDEINELEGKEFWGHVAWKNLPEGDYGGEYARIRDDRNNELSIIITHLANKRAATDLVKQLREGEVTQDDLCAARGYDVAGIRQAIGQALGNANQGNTDAADAPPVLTAIGKNTAAYYTNVKGFLQDSVIEFLKTELESTNDLNAVADKFKADIGDIAFVLDQKDFFRGLMKETGKSDAEAVVEVAAATGMAGPADLAKLLGVTEAAF